MGKLKRFGTDAISSERLVIFEFINNVTNIFTDKR